MNEKSFIQRKKTIYFVVLLFGEPIKTKIEKFLSQFEFLGLWLHVANKWIGKKIEFTKKYWKRKFKHNLNWKKSNFVESEMC